MIMVRKIQPRDNQKMSKRNRVKNFHHQHKDQEQEFTFDFPDFMNSPLEEEAITGMMNTLIQASSQQTLAAIELTKVALDKNPSASLTEADIFATFKNAFQVIQDTSPLKSLWEKLSLDSE